MSVNYDIYDLYDNISSRAIESASKTMNTRNIIGDNNRKMVVRLVFKQFKVSLKEAKRENRKRIRWEKRIDYINNRNHRLSVKTIKRLEKVKNKKRGRVGA